jgi:hypothetical protein
VQIAFKPPVAIMIIGTPEPCYGLNLKGALEHRTRIIEVGWNRSPNQITAVYESMLPRQPLSFVLANDPGTGKTIRPTSTFANSS